jgi:exonuclease VII small subunit
VLSIEKPVGLLGYAPAYEPDAAILESLRRLLENGELTLERPLIV